MNILLCGDDEVYIETVLCIFELFAPEDNITVTKTLRDTLCTLTYKKSFDIIIFDLSLSDSTSLIILRKVLMAIEDITPIIILTMDTLIKDEEINLGARLYKMKKDLSGEEFVNCVHNIRIKCE